MRGDSKQQVRERGGAGRNEILMTAPIVCLAMIKRTRWVGGVRASIVWLAASTWQVGNSSRSLSPSTDRKRAVRFNVDLTQLSCSRLERVLASRRNASTDMVLPEA